MFFVIRKANMVRNDVHMGDEKHCVENWHVDLTIWMLFAIAANYPHIIERYFYV